MLFRVELHAERRLVEDGDRCHFDREVVYCSKEIDRRTYWTEFVFKDRSWESAVEAVENFSIARVHNFPDIEISLQRGKKGVDGRFTSKHPPKTWTLRLE